MTTNNSNVINVPITVDGKELNITITINKTQSLTTETEKLEDIKLPFVSKEEFELTFAEDNDEIRRLLLENINGKYKNNLELVEEKLNNIKDEQYKNGTIKKLLEVVKKSYNDENENENILLYLVKKIRSVYLSSTFGYLRFSRLNNDYGEKANYKIIKLLLENNLYDTDSYCDFGDILYFPSANIDDNECMNIIFKAFNKYDAKIVNEFIKERYCGLPYYLIVFNYNGIKDKINFCDVTVYKELTTNIQKLCPIGLLDCLCDDGQTEIALRVLDDEDKYIEKIKNSQIMDKFNTLKNKKQNDEIDRMMEYTSEYALKRALENNMVDVVFKMVQMRQKYGK